MCRVFSYLLLDLLSPQSLNQNHGITTTTKQVESVRILMQDLLGMLNSNSTSHTPFSSLQTSEKQLLEVGIAKTISTRNTIVIFHHEIPIIISICSQQGVPNPPYFIKSAWQCLLPPFFKFCPSPLPLHSCNVILLKYILYFFSAVYFSDKHIQRPTELHTYIKIY